MPPGGYGPRPPAADDPLAGLYAHSLEDAPPERWEPLRHHLEAVGRTAAGFAAAFGAEDLGAAVGLLHDLGKARPGFQSYIRGKALSTPHSGEGARAAVEAFGASWGRLLAFAVAGHHAGLANGTEEGGGLTPLAQRLRDCDDLANLHAALPLPAPLREPPAALRRKLEAPGFSLAFLTRMFFSCLIDADRLETERFYAAATGEAVQRGWPGRLSDLEARLEIHLAGFAGSGAVDGLRREVLAACRARAAEPPGLFSLTVPTGGGKTLSSLAFALAHARRHGMERVVYVIPFTSVVEQTAAVFREALQDDDAVLEHHSAFDWRPDPKDAEGRDGLEKLRRAAENWDRPIVVTTAVQFFESLFANHPSRCRKLHRLARAVIVLDEAQTLPQPLLRPCLAAIRELAGGYRSSLVLCTATQPAVTAESGFASGEALTGVREIAPEPRRLHRSLRRVRVAHLGALTDAALLEALVAEPQCLCIVNNRRHARYLYGRLRQAEVPGARLLTTAITPADRAGALGEIKQALEDGVPLRLVSTSLVEAGVDIDFPLVLRALAGIDSLTQAAGRCNREGRLGPEGGRFHVFLPEETQGKPPPELKVFADIAGEILERHPDPLAPEAVEAYFARLYWQRGDEALDGKCILERLRTTGKKLDFPFASIAQDFRIIETNQRPLIIPAEAGVRNAPDRLIEQLRHCKSLGGLARDLQHYTVAVPRQARQALLAAGAARLLREEDFGDQFALLTNRHLYRPDSGLDWSDPTYLAAEELVS